MNTYNVDSSKIIRQSILTMSYNSKVAHIPSAFSMCDYLGVLFDNIISPQTHQFVLGKPFGAQAYYALFAFFGWIENDLSKYGSLDPEWRYIIQNSHPLITYIDESMGNCLSIACGIATAGRDVFVNISDAAFQEGTIWESIQYAGAKRLSNIIMSIDNNNMQALGRISEINDLPDFQKVYFPFRCHPNRQWWNNFWKIYLSWHPILPPCGGSGPPAPFFAA